MALVLLSLALLIQVLGQLVKKSTTSERKQTSPTCSKLSRYTSVRLCDGVASPPSSSSLKCRLAAAPCTPIKVELLITDTVQDLKNCR